MKLQASYPVIVTEKLAHCREFYVHHFDFQIVFEATWFVYLMSKGGEQGVAFMTPDHPSHPPGPERFSGAGMFLTLQVSDAAKEFERLQKLSATFAYPLTDEDWGQRRFALVDPSGMWIDVVEQISPRPGFWDRYLPST